MKIFVGCSSSDSIPNKYLEDARKFLGLLFEKEHDLIFGACGKGIMGIAYNKAMLNNRKIIGVCPNSYKDDLEELTCTTEIITKSISERTDKLIEGADVLLFLPGGIGTIYEVLAAIESKRSGEFDKPIIIYNSNNFFDKLFELLNKIYDEEFTSVKVSDCYSIFGSFDDLIAYFEEIEENLSI